MSEVADLLSVSKTHVICSEIQSVTTVMRKNSRLAVYSQPHHTAKDDSLAISLGLRRVNEASQSSSGAARQEIQLMNDFLELKRDVRSGIG